MIVSILIFLSGVFQAVIESLHIKFYQSIFYRVICYNNSKRENWWNAAYSWKNKYKNGMTYRGRKSLSIFMVKFPIPSLFYSATDLFRMLSYLCIIFSIPLYNQIFEVWYFDFYFFLFIWNSSRILFKSIFVI